MDRLVIFDLDGTLLNTLDDLTNAVISALSAYGFPIREKEEVRVFIGNGIRKLIERAVPDGTKKEDTDRVFEAFKEYYSAHFMDNTRPYPWIPRLLSELKSRGIKIAVVSNKADEYTRELAETMLHGYVDYVVGAKADIKSKPAPDAVISILNHFAVDAKNTVFVGDSEVDIQTAKNAGIACVSVTWGYKDREYLIENGAKNIAENGEEALHKILKCLNMSL